MPGEDGFEYDDGHVERSGEKMMNQCDQGNGGNSSDSVSDSDSSTPSVRKEIHLIKRDASVQRQGSAGHRRFSEKEVSC